MKNDDLSVEERTDLAMMQIERQLESGEITLEEAESRSAALKDEFALSDQTMASINDRRFRLGLQRAVLRLIEAGYTPEQARELALKTLDSAIEEGKCWTEERNGEA